MKAAVLRQIGRLDIEDVELDGAHAGEVRIPTAPPASAALLGCAMLTGVGSVLNAAKVAPGSTVVVIGCGGTGPVMARQFVEQGAKVLMVARHGEDGFFVGRLSASRIQLARQSDDGWQIAHRQNYMLDGSPQGPAMLARLNEGPAV